MAGTRKRSEVEELAKDGEASHEAEEPAAKKRANASSSGIVAQEDQAQNTTEMLCEIASLKKTLGDWKSIFAQELGIAADEEHEDEDEGDARYLASIRTKLGAIRAENVALTASLLESQRNLDEARKEAAYAAACNSEPLRKVGRLLMDPGLARQFRHMESEVDQCREMMKEMQDQLVAVTYSPDAFERKEQVDRLHALRKENEALKSQQSGTTANELRNKCETLRKQVAEISSQHKSLQEYTKTLDRDYNELVAKTKQASAAAK